MRAIRRNAGVLAALAVLILPGGSLVVGAVWLYRYIIAGRVTA